MENEKVLPYVRLVLGLAAAYFVGLQADDLFAFFGYHAESAILKIFFVIALVCSLSFIIFYLSSGTALPSFVVAVFFGIAVKPLLMPAVRAHEVLGAMVGFGATLILFGGGLETPWSNFKKLMGKILALSFGGLLVTALLFSLLVGWLAARLGLTLSVPAAVLLGAVLASTDPAAIIPVLKQLRFANRDTKDIIISESAVTDVTGTLLTVVFLALIASGVIFPTVVDGYRALFTPETGVVLLKQIGFGVAFGVVGYAFLEALTRFKQRHEREFEADAAYFLFVPVIIFTIALSLGGSGYLAAFIAGLLFVLTENLHETERFFNHTVDGFLKPMIFLLLGALVDGNALVQYAGVGLIAAFAFMFLMRPIAVFFALGPFTLVGKNRLGWRELLFISWVRETGAIPAVLLVTIVSLQLPGMAGLLPIGMWVILATLIVGPPLTPLVARWLKIATPIADDRSLQINGSSGPFIVLGSRGRSYVERLPRVVDWASRHGIKRVVLLHCLEDKYTPVLAQEIGIEAEAEFAKVNRSRELRGQPLIKFSYVSRTGFLQQNIDELSREQDNCTAIFVGRKVLDYRLSEIKQLSVPLFFVE